ncbi:ribonuclease HII [Halobacillus rhizosphaerae]|uniref:ribonuclease HII n=1 Tax=Halobacillus rhizosphaerae TaxID=3064889 RepID=UPI00398B0DBB
MKKTVQEIKQWILENDLSEADLENLKHDSRKGVLDLVRQYERKLEKKKAKEIQYFEMMEFERQARAKGKVKIAGVDEAGRGPLAGPVVASAVILPEGFYLEGLNDSKQLSRMQREEFYQTIRTQADIGVGIVTNKEIDQINIYQSTKLAMKRAVESLDQEPDYVLVDAMEVNQLSCPQESLIKGDERSVSIAAASVIAKVTRDNIMKELHEFYPDYDFISNQGYGTKNHLQALDKFGATPYHRVSFSPVKEQILS